ncbi:metallophosphoesterase [Leptolyngbya sp. 15MV]|nr:metallophosphoesterase [Leptolyngbya sp. 15MV]
MWRSLAAEAEPPSLVITGGDHIMHSMDQLKSRVEALWAMWHRVKREECRFDTFPVIGNHDCWGWHPASEAAEGDPRRGKAWALEGLELRQRFYSITGRVPGWRIIVLDGVQPHPERMYQGRLDDEQFEWLRGELAATPATEHVLIATHIPILSVGVTLNSRVFVQGGRKTDIDARDMHTDASRVLALLDEFPQVRGVISGHLHQTDRVEYAGPRAAAEGRPPIVHLCNGAASGAWWRGTNINSPQAYALLDLHADGRIERTIRPFPHTVRDPDDMPPRRSP